jgi:hypothetical protein
MRPNRPHIPSFIYFSKSSEDKQFRAASLLAFSNRLISSQSFSNFRRLPPLRFAFQRLFRFGEAVFTEEVQKSQEGKETNLQKTSKIAATH